MMLLIAEIIYMNEPNAVAQRSEIMTELRNIPD
jgi:hypothetical protein